jgi:arylsulfatase A-like enzyme
MLRFDPASLLKFKPNIVWIVAEDLSPILPAYGDSTIETPNIDRLAKEGVVYTNVFSPSGVCAPSRCAITTGMYPSSIGGHNMRVQYVKSHMDQIGLVLYEVVPPPEVKMMSQILRENGYYCTNNDKQDYQFIPPVTAWDESSLKAHWRHRTEKQPFFSVFNIGVTHEGHVTRPYRKQLMRYHDPDFPETTANPADFGDMISEEDWPLNIPADMDVPVPPYLPSTDIALNDIRRIYSNIIELDRQIGTIISQLEEDQLLDSTIVFFYSDHGGPLPRQKRLIYDSGIKVPMVIRYPGQIGAGSYDDQLISFIDLAPTIFSISGIKIPAYVQGQAFSGKYKARNEREYIHAAADRFDAQVDMIRAVRDDRYKYLLNFYPDRPYYLPVKYREQMAIMKELLRLKEIDSLDSYQSQWFREKKLKEELFDTWKDPHELHNLAGDPDYAGKLAELREECSRWMESTNDMGKIPEASILENFWPDREQPVTAAPSYKVVDGTLILRSETEGASIGYKAYGFNEPAPEKWEVYTRPLTISVDTRIEAVAHRIGYGQSESIKIEFR